MQTMTRNSAAKTSLAACPPKDQIDLWLQHRLTIGQNESLLEHFDQCSRCRETVQGHRLSNPSWLEGLSTTDSDQWTEEEECQQAISEMVSVSATLHDASTTRPDESEAPGPERKSSAASDFGVPETLGEYRLIRLLGQGAMGQVVLAEHRRLQRECAIKLLPRDRISRPDWLDRFGRELRGIGSLNSPHIVQATDAGFCDGWHFLVMEYLDGLDLHSILRRVGPLPVSATIEIIRQAAEGLVAVHNADLVHRDVKPSNMMLCWTAERTATLKLLDLGLVLAGDDRLETSGRLTTFGHVIGTLPYMAPEQLVDCRKVDCRSDIYSLGATFYRLLSGRNPHADHRGLAAQVIAMTEGRPTPLSRLRKDLPPEICQLIDRMMSTDPQSRPDAEQVSDGLARMQCQTKSPGDGDRQTGLLTDLLRHADSQPESGDEEPTLADFGPAQTNRDGASNAKQQDAAPEIRTPNRFVRWSIGIGFPALFLLAGVLIKIKTESGQLIIDAEAANATIEVLSGQEVVKELVVSAGADNRLTLRKGTYEIRVQGDGLDYGLSQDRVTITDKPAKVNLAGTAAADGGAGDSPNQDRLYSQDLLYDGRGFSSWMATLRKDRLPAQLVRSIRAVQVLSKSDRPRELQAATASIALAKQYGSWEPYEYTNDLLENPSYAGLLPNYFSFEFVDSFGDYSIDVQQTAIENELDQGINGNLAGLLLAFIANERADGVRSPFMEGVQKDLCRWLELQLAFAAKDGYDEDDLELVRQVDSMIFVRSEYLIRRNCIDADKLTSLLKQRRKTYAPLIERNSIIGESYLGSDLVPGLSLLSQADGLARMNLELSVVEELVDLADQLTAKKVDASADAKLIASDALDHLQDVLANLHAANPKVIEKILDIDRRNVRAVARLLDRPEVTDASDMRAIVRWVRWTNWIDRISPTFLSTAMQNGVFEKVSITEGVKLRMDYAGRLREAVKDRSLQAVLDSLVESLGFTYLRSKEQGSSH